MKRLKPVITEKTLKLAKDGKYTFFVDKTLNKHKIKELINRLFGVNVTRIATIKLPGEEKRTLKGRKKIIKPVKKAIVTLKEKEKIDLFEKSKK